MQGEYKISGRKVKWSFFFQGNLHDRYGHIVALYAKFLYLKMEFHAKVRL